MSTTAGEGAGREAPYGHKLIRVLFPTYGDRHAYGAQDLNGREIALRLDPTQFERSLFLRGAEADERLAGRQGIHLIRLPPIRKVRGLAMLLRMFGAGWDVAVCGKLDPVQLLYLGMRRVVGDRRPYLHTVENMNPRRERFGDAIARFGARHADRAFAISRKIADTPEPWCGRRLELMYAVGVDPSVFRPGGPGAGSTRKRVICCGSLQARKRPDFFVEMAARFPDQDFIWIGSGPMQSRLLAWRQEQQVENFKLLGTMAQESIAEEYWRADVFLFPSIHEGFPKVVVEAMACGLPALVFDAYGPEAVFDGQTGFVVRTDAEMERRLREVLQDDGLRTRLGHGAAQRALDFSWDKIVKNYERVILESCRPQGLVTATAR